MDFRDISSRVCVQYVCMTKTEESAYINLNAVGFKCSLERSKPRTVLHFDIMYILHNRRRKVISGM